MSVGNPVIANKVITGIEGTAALPDISFGGSVVGNSGDGLFLKSSGVIGVACAGSEVVNWSANGICLANDVRILQGSGAPVDGTTGAALAGAGSLYIRVAGASSDAYINCNTKASPTWKLITRAA